MSDELEIKLRELGRSAREQAEALTTSRRESAVRAALAARSATPESSRWAEWFASLFNPRVLAPAAGLCLLLVGLAFSLQQGRNSSSVLSSTVRVSIPQPAVEDSADDSDDEIGSDMALVGASFDEEVEAEISSDGEEFEEGAVSLSFSEDDFDQEEDFSSEDGTETI